MQIASDGKRIYINTDLIERVVDHGEDGLEVMYAGDPRPEWFTPETLGAASLVLSFRLNLRDDVRFAGLGAGPDGPTEYVNFNHVRLVILDGQKATVIFPSARKTYEGSDLEGIVGRRKRPVGEAGPLPASRMTPAAL
jgi:hypothetical protein